MNMERLKVILSSGESINIEFKQSKHKSNKDVSESVCAFLNHNGGHLFLGIDDTGKAVRIDNETKL